VNEEGSEAAAATGISIGIRVDCFAIVKQMVIYLEATTLTLNANITVLVKVKVKVIFQHKNCFLGRKYFSFYIVIS
jgi:hypothetical protein